TLLGQPRTSFADFEIVVYFPVRELLTGGNPYNSIPYAQRYHPHDFFSPFAPSVLLLGVPYGLMSLNVAAAVNFGVTLGLMMLLAYVALRAVGLKANRTQVLWLGALLVLSRPGRQNLIMGQLAAATTLATYAALLCARRAP